MDPIYFQRRGYSEFRFLSNFAESPFELMVIRRDVAGIVRRFPTVEHYYQAMKCAREAAWFEGITKASTPKEAKELGSKCPMDPDWEIQCGCGCGCLRKEHTMLDGLFMKFEQNAFLKERLLETGDRELIEYAPWGDTYWGVNKDLEGDNLLGRMLMLVRSSLSLEK